ncbi:MAG: hypothetical protein IKW53_02100 [Clostridia bacterium]|nr:hypothetical protein [Clostridia bacterium]
MYKGKKSLFSTVAQSFLICFALSIITIILFSIIAALVVNRLNDPIGSVGIFSLFAMILSAITSGVCCIRLKSDGGLRFCTLVALAVVLTMLLINVILSHGKVSLGSFMNYGCYMGLYILSSYIGTKRKTKSHRH